MNTTVVKQVKQACKFIIISFMVVSCNLINTKKTSRIEKKIFSFEIEADSLVIGDYNDEYHGMFVLNNLDTFYYNVGFVIGSIIIGDSIQQSLYDLSDEEKLEEKINQKIDTFFSNNYQVKLVYPKDGVNKGLIGVALDSLFLTQYGSVKMNLYCPNLNISSYKIVKLALKKIEIKVWDTTALKIPLGTYFIQ